MNFTQYVTVTPLSRSTPAAFVSLALLLVVFISLVPLSLGKTVIPVNIPKALTSDVLHTEDVVIIVTGENILYVDNKIMTRQELKKLFANKTIQGLFIKVDRRASVGRVMDIWDAARAAGIRRVNIASDREE